MIDKYFVTISDTLITILQNGTNLISKAEYTVFWRYPQNSFAVVATGGSEKSVELYNKLLKIFSKYNC
ncbi:MAG: hypothetical protein H6613_18600 [Ignavibacteriales bacterium]|nr:hypothetical protein [Ignavibacteriales bacterium]